MSTVPAGRSSGAPVATDRRSVAESVMACRERLAATHWHRPEESLAAVTEVLRRLREPACLAALISAARTDPELLGLSERRPWGDRMVVLREPATDTRLRLQYWRGGSGDPHGRPHNHRWPFASTILHGSYEHRLYGTVDEVEARLGTGPAEPLERRTERVGSLYALTPQHVHAANAVPGTVSLLLRGPAIGTYAVRLDEGLTAFSERKRGVATESTAERPQEAFTTGTADDLIAALAALGVLGRYQASSPVAGRSGPVAAARPTDSDVRVGFPSGSP
ncbi:hypothetical protein [Kitasatospora purpeofusca]|uniref:hypothetical protein n=1 Tax=Kitasatospora purpeofusca TaxID=67352 RepID=UPI0036D27D04